MKLERTDTGAALAINGLELALALLIIVAVGIMIGYDYATRLCGIT